MNADNLLPYLGLPLDAPEIAELLAKLDCPMPKRKGGEAAAINKKLGLELGFTNEAGLDVKFRDYKRNALVFNSVHFAKDYKGQLPHGLTFATDENAAIARLGKGKKYPYSTRWDFDDHCLFGRFDKEGIVQISIQLPVVATKAAVQRAQQVAKDKLAKEGAATAGAAFDWRAIYKQLGLDAKDLPVTDAKPGRWTIAVAKGLTLGKLFDAVRGKLQWKVFPPNKAAEFDREFPKHDRTAKAAYVVHVAPNLDGDPELSNQSADALAKRKVKGITMLEWLLLDVAVFVTSKKHLNRKNYATLCTGSRTDEGEVPSMKWTAKEILIQSFGAKFAHADLVGRAVEV